MMPPPISGALLDAMRTRAFYPHAVHNIQIIHTHISTLFLTGEFAYKIKKPVNFGFLDFTQLAARKHFCEEELRLNRRLAPTLYLDVLPILYQQGQYRLGAPEDSARTEVVEYAIKMRQFAQDQLLDRLAQTNQLPLEQMDELAWQIARFHHSAEQAPGESRLGMPETVLAPMQQNFSHLRAHLHEPALLKQIQQIEQWTLQEHARLHSSLKQRKTEGHIRACHGDMHLGNMARVNSEILIFDGIEFNDELRWIDTASDIAFLLMDLEDKNMPAHAHRLLNVYLQESGDYKALRMLNFYKTYRAMVRAKVAALSLGQTSAEDERRNLLEHCRNYLQLAETYIQPTRPALLITHGVSGSGKSWGCRALADHFGFIQLRSDVERKRLPAIPATTRQQAKPDQGIYTPEMSQRTYARLAELATLLIQSGHTPIVDATFLDFTQRQIFHELAQSLSAPFVLLHFTADKTRLQANILKRRQAGGDASDADLCVLQKQLENHPFLRDDEARLTLEFGEPLPFTLIQEKLCR